jgi:hypothetical protein
MSGGASGGVVCFLWFSKEARSGAVLYSTIPSHRIASHRSREEKKKGMIKIDSTAAAAPSLPPSLPTSSSCRACRDSG